MCRAIKTLHNFEPPASDEEIRASALQFVRKLSGFARPSRANDAVFARAVEQVTEAARALLGSLVTTAAPRDRAVEADKARARSAGRYGAPAAAGDGSAVSARDRDAAAAPPARARRTGTRTPAR
jgi:hypothetical protein